MNLDFRQSAPSQSFPVSISNGKYSFNAVQARFSCHSSDGNSCAICSAKVHKHFSINSSRCGVKDSVILCPVCSKLFDFKEFLGITQKEPPPKASYFLGWLTRLLRRALDWQSRGQRFDPAYLKNVCEAHQNRLVLMGFFLFHQAQQSHSMLNCDNAKR